VDARGRYFWRMGFIYSVISAGLLFLNRHASNSARTVYISSYSRICRMQHTSQAVNRPLLKLLECNVCCRRRNIEVQSVLVLQVLICGRRKLFLPMIQTPSPLRINSCEVLSDHCCGIVVVEKCCRMSKFEEDALTRRESISASAIHCVTMQGSIHHHDFTLRLLLNS
jgi:hypothetical protein